MTILGIDTTQESTGLILQKEERKLSFCATLRYRQSESLLGWIDKMLLEFQIKPCELEVIVCALGPGSFTNLRIGLSTAKGLCFGADCKLSGVISLDIFGRHYKDLPFKVLPLIDAKKNCFYTALYNQGHRETDYLDLPAEEILKILPAKAQILCTGPAASLFKSHLKPEQISENFYFLEAAHQLETMLAEGLKQLKENGPLAVDAGPFYLRQTDAEQLAKP